ncbi:MAG: type II toxin-antitoxin system VapC family toxin [Infirmifilum sp.]
MIKALLETGFLLALNPRDRNHEWATRVLNEAKKHKIIIFLSPASLIELSLILKSRGLTDPEISQVFDALNSLIKPKPSYPELTAETLSSAARLRTRYPELSFFDSIHAALTLENDLAYYDLDDVVLHVVESERG